MKSTPDAQGWDELQHARDQLESLVIAHPLVSMVDIGQDSQQRSRKLVLRVHVRAGDRSTLYVPNEIDGIPVRVVAGDYRLE